jgi:hypothetical protein
MALDREVLASAARRTAERHARIRALNTLRESAIEDVQKAEAMAAKARERFNDAEQEITALLDRADCLVHGNTLLELNPEGGLRVRNCTQLGLF